MEMRSQYKDVFVKKHGIKLSFMSAFIKASAYALQEQPIVNAVIEDLDIVYRDYIDISVAVSTPKVSDWSRSRLGSEIEIKVQKFWTSPKVVSKRCRQNGKQCRPRLDCLCGGTDKEE